MREIAEQSVGWLVIAGIAAAIWLGRRRGQQRFTAAVAAARAEGFAEGGAASATAAQHVQVAVDASHRGSGVHACPDPLSCPECAPLLDRLLLVARDRRDAAARIGARYYAADDAHPDDCAAYLDTIDLRSALASARLSERNNVENGDGDRRGGDRRPAGDGVDESSPPVVMGRGRGPGR